MIEKYKMPTDLFRKRGKERKKRIKRAMQERIREHKAELIRRKRVKAYGLK